ncbi:MAG: trans-sulfuration enzyme family protein [Candidatus Aminicenantaceae bacterium]
MSKEYKHFMTKAIHSGEKKPGIEGAVVLPIFQSAMYEFEGEKDYSYLKYVRLNNTPNHDLLHKKLADLENAESALVTSSGMAAISTALLTVLSQGDHLLIQDCIYGGTYNFINNDFKDMGITFDFIDGNNPSSWKGKLQKNTKAIYVESISNPLLQVADLKAAVDFASMYNLVSIVDNTFTSPVNFRPAEWGFDLSLHSCTKYLNGHSDIVAGTAIGKANLIEKMNEKLKRFGGSLDPHVCFLLDRGIKTLALRVKYQNESALKIAEFLENNPKVQKVNYPGLSNHPQYERACEIFDGFSGMLSFEVKQGLETAVEIMNKVNLLTIAPSLGGVETLMTRPATTSHAVIPPGQRKKMGISDSLIRLSIGLEDTQELIEDLDQAFN